VSGSQDQRPRIGAVLLAAGGGTRFRESAGALGVPVAHKLLAPLRGRTVFDHALANVLEAGIGPVAVVTGAVELPAIDARPDVTQLQNAAWAEGQATSLAVAVAWARSQGFDSLVCGLGDQPFIPAEAWRAVAGADPASSIVVATYGGRRRNPVRLRQSVWDLLPSSGDEGARPLMAARPDLVREVACDGNPADIDTAEDLLSWS
jgi:molybdenum cofactor cytidylyltransferase